MSWLSGLFGGAHSDLGAKRACQQLQAHGSFAGSITGLPQLSVRVHVHLLGLPVGTHWSLEFFHLHSGAYAFSLERIQAGIKFSQDNANRRSYLPTYKGSTSELHVGWNDVRPYPYVFSCA